MTYYLGRKKKSFNKGSQLHQNKDHPEESMINDHNTNRKKQVTVYFSVISNMALKLECVYTTCTHFCLNSKTSKSIGCGVFFAVYITLQTIFHVSPNSKTDLSFNNTDHNSLSSTLKDFS